MLISITKRQKYIYPYSALCLNSRTHIFFSTKLSYQLFLSIFVDNKYQIMNMSYLAPPTRITRIKHPKQYLYEKIDGQHHRRIFAKPPYQPFEQQSIKQLKDYLNKKAPYMDYSDQLLLRLNYSGNFLLSQVTEKVKQYDEWHENQVITQLHKSGRQILQHGHLYAYGRDYDYCPIIFVKVNQIDLKKYTPDDYLNATAALLQPLETHMLVPGVIEKWNLILDFQAKKNSITNIQQYTRYFAKIAIAYPYRLKRLLFINTLSQNDSLKNILISLLDGNRSFQVEIHTIGNWSDLQQMIPQQQRQKKYGGTLPNLCEYWPIHTTNKYQQSSQIDSQSQYQTVMNNAQYFQTEKHPFCYCGNGRCHIY